MAPEHGAALKKEVSLTGILGLKARIHGIYPCTLRWLCHPSVPI